MNKGDLIQKYINDRNYSTYLEIGVFKGVGFLPIECGSKIAVDPKFKIDFIFLLKRIIRYPGNIRNRYFQISSEQFFANKADKLFEKNSLDITLVDGLHTFRQSLQDILNSLNYLNDDGVILVHDCFPPHKAASTPAKSIEEARLMNIPGWDDLWCGDVWKSIVYLKKKYSKSLNIVTINDDFGIGVIEKTIKGAINLLIDEVLFAEIDLLNYNNLTMDTSLINLIEPEDFSL